jgi:UDP-N-acetylmuramate: L-alanyl-gamma-D-glutamyl-meso-diaminopimelate ligase
MALARECRGSVITYGFNEKADWRLLDLVFSSGEVQLQFRHPAHKEVQTLVSKLPGRHNASNTLAVAAAANLVGLQHQSVQDALLSFRGVKRRQEILGEEKGILIIDDFAHHPTAVLETIEAIRQFYPEKRLIAAFEPRTNSSRRSVFQEAYASAFDRAHITCIKQPPGMEAVPGSERLNTERLVTDVQQRGNVAHLFKSSDDLINFLLQNTSSGDLVLCMSNGSFDGLPQRLLQSIKNN